MKQERDKMLCKPFFCFVPTLTKPTCGPEPVCVCVHRGSVHDHPTPLYEATFAGNSNGNVYTTTTHKCTHTQTNKYVLCFEPLIWTFDFSLKPVRP